MSDYSVITERLAALPPPGQDKWADRYAVDIPHLLALLALYGHPLLRRVLGEYVAGNKIVDGYWYAPDETGAPHYINQPATPDELALIRELREEGE